MTGPSGATISNQQSDEEGILYAHIDVAQCVQYKQFHDISGGYNRFDIFQLTVNRSANRPVTFVSRDPTASLGAGEKENSGEVMIDEEIVDRT